jgi:hypothetical protein
MTNFTKAIVRLTNKDNYSDVYDLEFDLIQSNFLHKWIDRYLEAKQCQYNISEPWAFYNLNSQWTPEYTLEFLNYHIEQCNLMSPGMFEKKLDSLDNQDTLNQIHSVFELHHGKLDEWLQNPLLKDNPTLRSHLSHVNQAVHRCEMIDTELKGKLRIVYFDLPKTQVFSNDDYQLFSNQTEFGGMYTLYADVGKNVESLAQDNDDHHHDFVPNLHYSVDCAVKFFDESAQRKDEICRSFINDNQEYFTSKGYCPGDPRLTSGSIKIAQLIYQSKQEVLDRLRNYNHIQDLILY